MKTHNHTKMQLLTKTELVMLLYFVYIYIINCNNVKSVQNYLKQNGDIDGDRESLTKYCT